MFCGLIAFPHSVREFCSKWHEKDKRLEFRMLLKICVLAMMMASQTQFAFEVPSLILYSFSHSFIHRIMRASSEIRTSQQVRKAALNRSNCSLSSAPERWRDWLWLCTEEGKSTEPSWLLGQLHSQGPFCDILFLLQPFQ